MVCEVLAATGPCVAMATESCVAKCTGGGDNMTGDCARWPGLRVAATVTVGVAVVVLVLMVSVLAFVAALVAAVAVVLALALVLSVLVLVFVSIAYQKGAVSLPSIISNNVSANTVLQ